MRKFEDILRILSSVLLGTLVRDFDLLSGGLKNFFINHHSPLSSHAQNIATVTSVILILVYVRNIHASARYDDFLEKTGYALCIDRKLYGRWASYCFNLMGLFAVPFAGHILAHHLADAESAIWLSLPLFLSFIVYGLWDAILWLAEPEQHRPDVQAAMDDIMWKWLVVDALGLLLVFVLLLIYFRLTSTGQAFPAEVTALFFVVIAAGTIIADYFWNHRLYFPSAAEQLALTKDIDEPAKPTIEELASSFQEQNQTLMTNIIDEIRRDQDRTRQMLVEVTRRLDERPSLGELLFQFLDRWLSKKQKK
ncbi:MAG: hypothetical protein ACXW1F_04725 [Halobacteriota archaeon]